MNSNLYTVHKQEQDKYYYKQTTLVLFVTDQFDVQNESTTAKEKTNKLVTTQDAVATKKTFMNMQIEINVSKQSAESKEKADDDEFNNILGQMFLLHVQTSQYELQTTQYNFFEVKFKMKACVYILAVDIDE